MEKAKKVRTLYQEHKAAFFAYFSLMLSHGSNLVMDFMGIRWQTIPLLISGVLCVFMVIAMFRWLSPKFGSQPIHEDEMAKENLNKAVEYTCAVLVTLGIIGVAVLTFLNFSVTIKLNAFNIGSAFFMTIGLFFAMRSGFFLLIERKYSISDEDEEE